MELSNYLVSWVVTYLGDLQPTCIGVIIYLLSTIGIPVVSFWKPYIYIFSGATATLVLGRGTSDPYFRSLMTSKKPWLVKFSGTLKHC